MTNDDPEVRAWYDPNRDRTLSDAVLSAIESAKDADLSKEDDLFEDVDPAAIDDLFRESGRIRTTVTFHTDDSVIRVEPGGKFEIRVATLAGPGSGE